MSTKMQNGSGSTTESQDDESHIKSLAELKSLWEGMASKNERSLNPNGQKKPQLVRGDRSRQMENPQWSSTLSPSTISGPMSTPTSSVATATLSLAAPSSSTTKLKSSTTTPVSGMTTNRSSMTASVVPMATQASSTTIPSSSMIKPANYRATPPSSVTTGTSSVARTTSSTSTSGVLSNDATSSSDNGPSSRSSLPFAADRCVKVDGPNRSEILRLVDDGSDGARQTVTVERTEEELTKEMMEALQVSGDPSKGVTNVDVVEERLDVELSNGLAQVKVTVHCERIVPNRMSGQSYRKSSVTVIRTTEVDMLATPERRQIYERVVDRYGTPEAEVSRSNALVHRNKLSTDDVYTLYRVFVEVTGRSRSIGVDPGNQMIASLSKSEVAGLELLSGQSLPLSLLRLGPLISPVSLTQ